MEVKMVLALLNARLYQDLSNMLADLTESQLAYQAPHIDSRCIQDVAIHAYRPVLAVVCVLAGDEWPSRSPSPTTKDELFHLLHTMRRDIDEHIACLVPTVLEQIVVLPWSQQQPGLDALVESFTHGLFHVGALQGIRALGGFPTPAEVQ